MKRPLFALSCAAIAATAFAQDIALKDSELDPLLSALKENSEDSGGPSVTVDLRATAPAAAPATVPPAAPEEQPVLVTGRPPGEGEEAEANAEPPPPVPEPEGVVVNVEPGTGGTAAVDAKSVKLLAPFNARPLSHPPAGWRLEHPKELPAFTQEVALKNGTHIQLSIRPHLLVPDADGARVISVKEPGFEAEKRYAQTGTMSAVLSNSIDQLDKDSHQMVEALDRLEQLLGSLPATEAPPRAHPVPAPAPSSLAPNRKPPQR